MSSQPSSQALFLSSEPGLAAAFFSACSESARRPSESGWPPLFSASSEFRGTELRSALRSSMQETHGGTPETPCDIADFDYQLLYCVSKWTRPIPSRAAFVAHALTTYDPERVLRTADAVVAAGPHDASLPSRLGVGL